MALLYLFSPNVPGMSADAQVATAIRELETYKSMRGKTAPGATDDVDELLSRAKQKQNELKTPSTAPAAAPAPAAAGAAKDAGAAAPKK
jgi:hypothetical protein